MNRLSSAFVLGSIFVCAGFGPAPAGARADDALSAAQPSGASADWWLAAQRDVAASEYRATWQDQTILADLPAAYQAANRAQNLRTYFTTEGIRVVPRVIAKGEAPAWEWGLTLVGSGRDGVMSAPACAEVRTNGNRVEYQRGDVTEWYVNDARGLEQGFTIHQGSESKRSGILAGSKADALMRLQLAVGGNVTAALCEDGQSVDFLAPGGARAIHFAELHVMDAKGAVFPAWFEVTGELVSMVVDDAGAAYPITIDPVATSPAWTAESNQAGANFGNSVATAGDVNGDGYSDVIVGAPYYDNGQADEGRAYVYLGSASGLSATPHWMAEGDQADARFGIAVATAGDVNSDGYSDVIVGAQYYDNGEMDEGRAFVFHGSAAGLSATANWTAESNQAGAGFGHSVATAGDVNGDGYSDVIVGAYFYDNGQTDEGRVFVYHGSAAGLSAAPNWTAESDQDSALFGISVATAGDVNGDGYSDVIVGALFYDNGQADEGRAFVYHGSAAGLSATPNWTGEGDQVDVHFGLSVSTAGDVNGDGYGDVIVGANYFSNGESQEGRAFIYHGSAAGLSVTANWTAESNQANAYFGAAVSTAGDVNGDGYGDVIVGAFYFDNGQVDEGRAFIYLGSASGLSGTAAWTAESDQANAVFGISVATAGDVNGDGYCDVIVGSPMYDSGEADEGLAYVYYGSAAGLSATASWTAEGNQFGAYFGYSVATAGDVNGDGYGDVIVGASAYDNGGTNRGRVFVYLGSAAGLSVTPAWSVDSNHGDNSTGSFFGFSAANAGDVNGDGYSDVIVGAPYYDNDQTDEGRAFVYFGSAAGLGTTPNWTAEGDQTGALFGYSVAAAGDVNGDGYSDVIVGSPSYDNGEVNEGRAYIYLGSAVGLNSAANWSAESNQINALFGVSVSSAGDVNGDGYSDVIVGARSFANGEVNEGRAFVYLGSASGPSATANWTAESNQIGAFFGYSVATAGDVNGDGYSDVIVGAYNYDNGEADEGRAFVYLGSASGLSVTANWTAESNQISARFGYSVATAGDVNGDGYGDVIVGSPMYDSGEADEGLAYVYYGSAAGLSATASWTAENNQANAFFGYSVATAGDVNGDGYSDVIVGARNFDNGEDDEGRAYVYYGNGGPGKAIKLQQRRVDDTAPIDKLGRSDSASAFRLAEIGRTPFGRGKVKLEYEIKPLGTPFDGIGLQQGAAYIDTGVSGAPLNELATGLNCSRPYHWRARTRYNPVTTPFQPYGRWVSAFPNGWQEADVRTKYGALGDMNCDCLLDFDDVPAFALALVDPAAYAKAYPLCGGSGAGDFQGDGDLDGGDVQAFVDLLVP